MNTSPDVLVADDFERLQQLVNADLERFEGLLAGKLSGARGVIDDVTGHLSAAGGKRMRPILTFLCANIGQPLKPVNDDVMRSALVVELTHLATLYHDDVMDSAPTRRGVDAVQKVWGNNRAILAGDVIFSRASQLVATLGPDATFEHSKTFERLCVGQLNETFGPEQTDDRVDFYIQVLADKTGSLIAEAAKFGAQFAGADAAYVDAVSRYGEAIGVAFQIADDVLDVMSDGDVSGKTPGTDLKEGVDTLPILLLRRRAAAGQADEAALHILSVVDQKTISDTDVADVLAALRVHDVMDETRELARTWAAEAKDALGVLPDGVAKQGLFDFADLLADRLK